MNIPELSVIICTYNRSNHLISLFTNFQSQEFENGKFHWELIIVDNNSNDDTSEVVQQWKSETELPIRYLFEPKQGKSFALNRGIKHSRGMLIAFTDDDVILDRKWLSNIYQAFQKYPYNCFGGRVLPILKEDIPSWTSRNEKYAVFWTAIGVHDHGEVVKEYQMSRYGPAGANMFVRKEVFLKYGDFNTNLGFINEDMRIGEEDTELMYRFMENGEKVLYVPQVLVHHLSPPEHLKKSYIRKTYWGSGRSHARWLIKADKSKRYMNIPGYLIKHAVLQFICFVFYKIIIRREDVSFYHEMMMIYRLGSIYDFYMSAEDRED